MIQWYYHLYTGNKKTYIYRLILILTHNIHFSVLSFEKFCQTSLLPRAWKANVTYSYNSVPSVSSYSSVPFYLPNFLTPAIPSCLDVFTIFEEHEISLQVKMCNMCNSQQKSEQFNMWGWKSGTLWRKTKHHVIETIQYYMWLCSMGFWFS